MAVDRGKRLRALDQDAYRAIVRDQIARNSAANDNGCWIWKGTKQRNGYASTRLYGKVTPAHRASYFAFGGTLQDGLDICHSCDVRDCVNPGRLFQASHAENMTDAATKGRCKNGTMAGTYTPRHGSDGKFISNKEAA